MDEIKRYEVVYTETAVRDMEQKSDYITWHFGAPDLAETWYFRLRADIQEGLSTFPYKFQIYDVPPWNERGIRLYLSRNDVILYRVDEAQSRVYIEGVYTKGKDLSAAQELGVP